MPICKAMLDQADAIYLLNNWENSIGATEEYNYANKKIFFGKKREKLES